MYFVKITVGERRSDLAITLLSISRVSGGLMSYDSGLVGVLRGILGVLLGDLVQGLWLEVHRLLLLRKWGQLLDH